MGGPGGAISWAGAGGAGGSINRESDGGVTVVVISCP